MANQNKSVVYVLAIALALAGFAIAFLLGRESKTTDVLEPANGIEQDPVQAEGPGPDPATGGGDVVTEVPDTGTIVRKKDGEIVLISKGQPEPDSAAPAPPSAAPESPSEAPPPVEPSAEDKQRLAVQQYFSQMDALQAGPMGMDPRDYANSIAADMAKGDRSGFDELIKSSKALNDKVRKIDPPDPCRDVHKKTMALMEDSLDVVEEMSAALKRNDLDKLTTIAFRAKKLEAAAQKIELEQKTIKKRYGAY